LVGHSCAVGDPPGTSPREKFAPVALVWSKSVVRPVIASHPAREFRVRVGTTDRVDFLRVRWINGYRGKTGGERQDFACPDAERFDSTSG